MEGDDRLWQSHERLGVNCLGLCITTRRAECQMSLISACVAAFPGTCWRRGCVFFVLITISSRGSVSHCSPSSLMLLTQHHRLECKAWICQMYGRQADTEGRRGTERREKMMKRIWVIAVPSYAAYVVFLKDGS
ncbi:uncharacterized protein RDI95_004737 isoform 3-T14 [Morus bassanus]